MRLGIGGTEDKGTQVEKVGTEVWIDLEKSIPLYI